MNDVFVVYRWYSFEGQVETEMLAAFTTREEAERWAQEKKAEEPICKIGNYAKRPYSYPYTKLLLYTSEQVRA